MSQYRTGSMPRLDKLLIIAETADVNIEWLATGKGQMRKGEGESADNTAMVLAQAQEERIKQLEDQLRLAQTTGPEFEMTLGQGVEMLHKIYSSGNQVLVRAINANLAAFSETVDSQASERQAMKMIHDMREKEKEIMIRLETLEKRLTVKEKTSPENTGDKGFQEKAANG